MDDEDKNKCYTPRTKGVTALWVKLKNEWRGFPYMYMKCNVIYTPQSKIVIPFGDSETTIVTIEGRCLEKLADAILQHRVESVWALDRDIAGDGELIITKITVHHDCPAA